MQNDGTGIRVVSIRFATARSEAAPLSISVSPPSFTSTIPYRPSRRLMTMSHSMIPVDTRNILFIAGGAFDGIDRTIASRVKANAIGYNGTRTRENIDRENMLRYILPMDLKHFGIIPELVGRFPLLTHLDPLDPQALRQILTEPKNAITKQYQELFKMDGVELLFDKGALDVIVDTAVAYKLGARGLRSIMESVMTDLMFDLPTFKKGSQVHITKKMTLDKINKSNINPTLK